MPEGMLGNIPLSEIRGPMDELEERLAGNDGMMWLDYLKKFIRREPCWVGGQTTPSSKPKSVLRCIVTDLTIPATDGQEILDDPRFFTGGVDSDLKCWGCNVSGEAKPETKAEVHELIESATFQQMLKGQGVDDLSLLFFEQGQIKKFVANYRGHLRPQGYATLFPFKVKNKKGEVNFFVAVVRWRDDRRLWVRVFRLSCDCVWGASDRFRVVLPQLSLKP